MPLPMVYTSQLMECAMWYPGGYLGIESEMFGELIARDGTPPLRVILRARAPKKYRLWTRTKKKNNQHALRPQDVYISHMMIYALPANKVAPSQADRLRLGATRHQRITDGRKFGGREDRLSRDRQTRGDSAP